MQYVFEKYERNYKYLLMPFIQTNITKCPTEIIYEQEFYEFWGYSLQ
jgi:hypothetical protein